MTYGLCAATQYADFQQPRQQRDWNFTKYNLRFLIGVCVVHHESWKVGAQNCWTPDANEVAYATLQRRLDPLASPKPPSEQENQIRKPLSRFCCKIYEKGLARLCVLTLRVARFIPEPTAHHLHTLCMVSVLIYKSPGQRWEASYRWVFIGPARQFKEVYTCIRKQTDLSHGVIKVRCVVVGRVQLDANAETVRDCASNLLDDLDKNTRSPFSAPTILILASVALQTWPSILVKHCHRLVEGDTHSWGEKLRCIHVSVPIWPGGISFEIRIGQTYIGDNRALRESQCQRSHSPPTCEHNLQTER